MTTCPRNQWGRHILCWKRMEMPVCVWMQRGNAARSPWPARTLLRACTWPMSRAFVRYMKREVPIMNWQRHLPRLSVAIGLVVAMLMAAAATADPSEGILIGSTTGNFDSQITADGSLADWGIYWLGQALAPKVDRPNSDWLSGRSGVSYWVEDGVGCNGRVGPGYGGQNFDLEATYLGIAQSEFHGVIVTGGEQVGNRGHGRDWYYPGDIFFDTNNDNRWDFALGASDHGNVHAGRLYKPNAQYASQTWWTIPSAFSGSEPAQVRSRRVEEFLDLDNNFIYTNAINSDDDLRPSDSYLAADHNIIEFTIPWDILGLNGIEYGGTMLMHFTQTCGNDILDLEHIGVIPETPSSLDPSIPEPATIALLSCGMAGLLVLRRFKRA